MSCPSKSTLDVFVFQTNVHFVMGHTRRFLCVASGSRFVAFSPCECTTFHTEQMWRRGRSLIPSSGAYGQFTHSACSLNLALYSCRFSFSLFFYINIWLHISISRNSNSFACLGREAWAESSMHACAAPFCILMKWHRPAGINGGEAKFENDPCPHTIAGADSCGSPRS